MVQSSIGSEEFIISHREHQILECVANGCSAKEVAKQINIAPRTVERYIENMRLKMHAKNSPHMIARAFSIGMLTIGP